MVAAHKAAMRLTLPSDREIVLTRDFEFPRRLVFEAFSKPEHVKQWWGPRGYTMEECEMDFRPGGAWRYVIKGPDGVEPPFKGVYREISAPERLVYTFIYDVDMIRDHPVEVTVVLREHRGVTTMTETMVFDSVESRDGMMASGMEGGAAETLDRLAELLATM